MRWCSQRFDSRSACRLHAVVPLLRCRVATLLPACMAAFIAHTPSKTGVQRRSRRGGNCNLFAVEIFSPQGDPWTWSHRCCKCPMHNGCFGMYHSMMQPRDTSKYRNRSLYSRRLIGLLTEIDPILLPGDSKYLLEIDFSSFHRDTLERQSYGLLVMKATVKAGQRTVARLPHATAWQRGRASARANSPRQVNGGTIPRTITAGSMRGESGRTRTSKAVQELQRRCGYIIAGAAEIVQ